MNPTLMITLGYLAALVIAILLCIRFLKPFHRRAIICLTTIIISALIVTRAGYQYAHGEGGFRLGVDLVGGTILIYEVDTDRLAQQKLNDPNAKEFDPAEMAAFLKRRIDPADLYNVTIRPDSKTRFEIILPSGGANQDRAEENLWNDLLTEVRNPAKWKAFFEKREQATTDPAQKEQLQRAAQLVPAAVPVLEHVDLNLRRDRDPLGRLSIRVEQDLNWEMLKQMLREKYPALKDNAKALNVPAGRVDELIESLKGPTGASPDDLRKFIEENSRLMPEGEIGRFLRENYQGTGRRGATAEYVQMVKNLIAQQGSLEFRIIANRFSREADAAAYKAAEEWFKDKDPKAVEARIKALRDAAAKGAPPPAPVVKDIDPPYTYSWIELGPKERETLHLTMANKSDDPRSLWKQMATAREQDQGVPVEWQSPAGGGGREAAKGRTTMLLWSRKTEEQKMAPEMRSKKAYDYFVLVRNPLRSEDRITGDLLVNAQVSETQVDQGPTVEFVFNSRGAQLFGQITSDNLPKGKEPDMVFSQLAIILDNQIVSAPSINSEIRDRGVIQGGFTAQSARELAMILRSGALPATLKPMPMSEDSIGPTLGADTIRKGTLSVLAAFVAVLAFMLVYYRFAGLVASIALLANLLLTVAFMVFVNATFTLPGLAGLVLTLGMAVDANVLIYERLREERERGASLTLALRNGYDRAFPTILDTHLTSIFTAIVLYAFGNDQLKGFGVSLTAGLVISLFTSLYMTRLMFDLWQAKGWLKKLSMYQGLTNFLHRHYIDFMRVRYYWFAATLILTIVGLAVFLIRGPAGLSIDFVGGTKYGGQLREPMRIEDLRNKLDLKHQEARLKVESVQQANDTGKLFNIKFADGDIESVSFKDPIPGATNQEREKFVAERAATLPDWSVVQTFLSSESNAEGASRIFTVSTTEKEPELAQVAINRLLVNDKGESLQMKITLDKFEVNGHSATLHFSAPASPAYIPSLVMQAYEALGGKDKPVFVVQGEGEGHDSRFKSMTLEVSGADIDDATLTKILQRTQSIVASRPLPERLSNVDAVLAAETSRSALYAILASWAAILLFLWFRFGNWTFGAAAVLCLVHDLCFTLGIIAACHFLVAAMPGFATLLGIEDFKIDLPAVAALLTLIGYSVSDTIVVFDRIREVRGKNPVLTAQTINDSVNHTLSRTLLASLTVFLVVLVLFIWGGEGVKLFAFVMVVGVIVGTYSSIYVASPLLLMFGEGASRGSTPRPSVPASATA